MNQIKKNLILLFWASILLSCGGNENRETKVETDPIYPTISDKTSVEENTIALKELDKGSGLVSATNDVLPEKGLIIGKGFAAHEADRVSATANEEVNYNQVEDFAKKYGWLIIGHVQSTKDYIFQLNKKHSIEQALIILNKSSIIKYSGKIYDRKLETTGTLYKVISNDPLTNSKNNQKYLVSSGVNIAWDLLNGNNNQVTVGVVDGGFLKGHEDLSQLNSISYFSNKWVDDSIPIKCEDPLIKGSYCSSANHGMHVTGIIGATTNNKTGVSGIASNLVIHGYRTDKTSANIARGFQKLKDKGAKIVNYSIGVQWCEELKNSSYECPSISDMTQLDLYNLFKEPLHSVEAILNNNSALIIQASGNEGHLSFKGETEKIKTDYIGSFATSVSKSFTPTSEDLEKINKIRKQVIIVGSYYIDKNNKKRLDERTQVPLNKNDTEYPFILAPGGNGKAKEYIQSVGYNHKKYYYGSHGTSMAAPYVAGVAALILKADPSLSASEVKDLIFNNADIVEGYKAINAEKAVRAALDRLAPSLSIDFNAVALSKLGATKEGQVSFITGKNGRPALKLYGVNSPGRIKIPNREEMKFTDGATFDMWVRLDSLTGMNGNFDIVSNGQYAAALIAKGHDSYTGGSSFFTNGFGHTWVGSSYWPQTVLSATSPNLPIGTWFRVTYTISKTNIKTYVDKNLIFSSTVSNLSFGRMNIHDLSVGYMELNGSRLYPVNGALQDLRIYKRTLSDAEVKALK